MEFLRENPEFAANIEKQVRESANTIYSTPSMARNTEAETLVAESELKSDEENAD